RHRGIDATDRCDRGAQRHKRHEHVLARRGLADQQRCVRGRGAPGDHGARLLVGDGTADRVVLYPHAAAVGLSRDPGVGSETAMRRARGFTLIELMVSMALAGLTSVFLLMITRAQLTAYHMNESYADAQLNARAGIDFLENTLRRACGGIAWGRVSVNV